METTTKLIDLTLLIWKVLLCIACKLLEFDIVLIDCHRTVLQITEFLTHFRKETGRNMMSFEIPSEVCPSDDSISHRIFVLLPPLSCLVFELERSKLDIVLRTDIAALEVFVDVHQPIVRIQRLGARTERPWLVTEKLTESGKLWLMLELPLSLSLPLISLICLETLHELDHHLSIGIGSSHKRTPSLRRRRWGWWAVLFTIS